MRSFLDHDRPYVAPETPIARGANWETRQTTGKPWETTGNCHRSGKATGKPLVFRWKKMNIIESDENTRKVGSPLCLREGRYCPAISGVFVCDLMGIEDLSNISIGVASPL